MYKLKYLKIYLLVNLQDIEKAIGMMNSTNKLLSRDGKMNSDESNKEFQTAKEMKFSAEDVFQ